MEADWITSTAGVVPAVSAAIAALLPAGAQIITQTPLYDPFESVIAANHCVCIHNPLIRDEAGRYTMDFAHLEQCMRSGASMMILCNPHNPVGRVWSRQELSAVLELCRCYGVILVSDEIHWDIIMPGYHHTTVGKLVTEEDNVIICTAPSKTFNIAGLQTSNIIIPKPALRARFQNWLYSRYLFGANVLGLKACAAAYTYGDAWADEQNQFLSQNAAFVSGYIGQHIPQAVVTPLEGTYLMWLDLSFLGRTSEELREIAKISSVATIGPSLSVVIVVIAMINLVGPAVTWMRTGVIGAADYELWLANVVTDALGVTLGGQGIGSVLYSSG